MIRAVMIDRLTRWSLADFKLANMAELPGVLSS